MHGEAVAIGMAMAFDLSTAMGLCTTDDAEAVRKHLTAVGLPTTLDGLKDSSWSADKLIAHMGQDKKVSDGKITFVVTQGIGQAFLYNDIPADTLRSVLDSYITA